MARTNTLGNFLTDVADAIRTKKGSEELIAAEDFDTEIENLPSGADLSEYFNNEITENRADRIQWDYLKKLPDLIVADNVTQLSYLFDRDYFKVNGKNAQISVPKVVCGNNVTNMSYMYASFSTDSNLTSIDLSGLNTSNVTNMTDMFYNRNKLGNLDFSTFNFSKVQSITRFIPQYSDMTVVELKNFVGESLTGFAVNSMFKSCSNLTKIDLSNLNPPRAVDARSMFSGCNKLEELYLDSWDLGATTPSMFASMFSGCGSSLTDGAVTKVYVKDADAQNWVLTASNGHPTSWTTDNVIIAGSEADLRNA